MPQARIPTGTAAENIAAGIRDMRPRKDGPVYDIFTEFVGNKKRKAVAVHYWVNSAQGSSQGAGVRRPGNSRFGIVKKFNIFK